MTPRLEQPEDRPDAIEYGDQALQYGDEAVRRVADEALADRAGALAKGRGKPAVAGRTVIIIAGGFPGYSNDAEEIKRLEALLWLPNTPDFIRTAADTQRDFASAANAPEFFGPLQHGPKRIGRIVFIGHGAPDGIGLSGDTFGLVDEKLKKSDLPVWQATIDSDIKPKLMRGARFDIYACNVAVGGSFTSALAQAFGICVRAFDKPVAWCVAYKDGKITLRGRIAPLAPDLPKSCTRRPWRAGVRSLIPPVETCP